jgi:Relaxase/Mobilisation nuclease domain
MTIGKIVKGSGFGGVFQYLLNPEKRFEILTDACQCLSNTPSALALEFQAVANRAPSTSLVARHYAIGFAPEDGEISSEIQAEIANRVMKEMGYGNAQYFAVAHHRDDPGHDKAHEHDHLHVVANAIDLNGNRVNDSWDYHHMERCLRGIERDYNLRQLECSWEKSKSVSIDRPLTERIDTAIEKAQTVPEWIHELQTDGIYPQFKITRTGKVQGVSYEDGEGNMHQGHKLGRSWSKIKDKLDYKEKDLPALKTANLMKPPMPGVEKFEVNQTPKKLSLDEISQLPAQTRPRTQSIQRDNER